jgi:hypothetical protein
METGRRYICRRKEKKEGKKLREKGSRCEKK